MTTTIQDIARRLYWLETELKESIGRMSNCKCQSSVFVCDADDVRYTVEARLDNIDSILDELTGKGKDEGDA